MPKDAGFVAYLTSRSRCARSSRPSRASPAGAPEKNSIYRDVSPVRYPPRVLDLTTTITVNGTQGERFLSSLGTYRAPVPRALRWLAQGDHRSIQVDPGDAEVVAQFVDEPLPRAGSMSSCRCCSRRASATTSSSCGRARRGVADGPQRSVFMAVCRGGQPRKLIGWRDSEGEPPRAADRYGVERRIVVFVAERKVTRPAAAGSPS